MGAMGARSQTQPDIKPSVKIKIRTRRWAIKDRKILVKFYDK